MTKPKVKKPETWWCVKFGKVLLPYTARLRRADCLLARVTDLQNNYGLPMSSLERIVKITVQEAR